MCFFVSPNLWMCFVRVPLSFGSLFLLWNPKKYIFLSDSNGKTSPTCSWCGNFGDLPHIQCHFVGLKKLSTAKKRHHIHFEVGKCWVGTWKGAGCCMHVFGALVETSRGLLWWCAYTFQINLFLQLDLLISRFTCHIRNYVLLSYSFNLPIFIITPFHGLSITYG